MKNLGELMKQAQQMQTKMASLQAELGTRTIEASAGGGMVKVKMNGKQELIELKINPECVDANDVEILEDMILKAVNQATAQSKEMVSGAMSKLTGGMGIPGMF